MKAKIYLIFSALMWGVNFHLLKVMLSSVHFIEAGFWRYFFGVIALGVYVGNSFPKWSSFKQNFSGILIVGVLGLFSFNIFLFWGLMYTSSINASLIISLNPIVTLLLANFFLKSGVNFMQLIGAVLGIIGVIYLISKGHILSLNHFVFSKGDILVLLAMFLSSFYHVWVNKYAKNISNKHFTFFTNLVCLLSFILITPFFVEPHTINYGIQFWIASISFGIFGTAFTYIFWNKGLILIGASKAGVFMNIVPLATAIFAIVLGKELTTLHVISGLLIFLGLVISQLKTQKTASNIIE